MTELQRALAGVQAPKIDRRVLQGAQYTGAVQQANQIDTTNPLQQVTGLVQTIGEFRGQQKDKQYAESQRLYQEAKSEGADPMVYAAERIKEEESSLGGMAASIAKGLVGVNPLEITQEVTAANEVRTEGFRIDKEFEEHIKSGRYKTHGEMLEARGKARSEAFKAIGEQYGVDWKSPFVQDQALKFNEQSTAALTDQFLNFKKAETKVNNQRVFTSDLNNMIEGNVDPSVYPEFIKQQRAAGVLTSDAEEFDAYQTIMRAYESKGDPARLKALMDTPFQLANGEMSTVGNTMPLEIREQLEESANSNLFKRDKASWEQFNGMLSRAHVIMQGGDGAGALAEVRKARALLDAKTGMTGNVTTQHQQLMQLETQILGNQAAANRRARDERRKDMEADVQAEVYNQRVLDAQNNGAIVDLAFASKEVQERALGQYMQSLQGMPPEQQQSALMAYASNTSDNSPARQAVQRFVDNGVQSMYAWQHQVETSGQAIDPPDNVKHLMKSLETNPAGVAMFIGETKMAAVMGAHDTYRKLGPEMMVAAQVAAPLAGEDKKSFDGKMASLATTHNLSQAEVGVLSKYAMATKAQHKDGGPTGESYNWDTLGEAALRYLDSTKTKVDGGYASLPNQYLAANGDQRTIKAVSQELDMVLEDMRKEDPSSMLVVNAADNGMIRITKFPYGRVTETSANLLYGAYSARYSEQAKQELEARRNAPSLQFSKNTANKERFEANKGGPAPYQQSIKERFTPAYQK